MSGADQSSAAFCAELVRSHDFDRYASTLFVPADKRRSLLALYAFNTEITRVRELVKQPLPGEIRLQWWTDMLAGAGHGDVEQNPVAAELLLAIRTHDLPIDRLSKLIDVHIFDLYNDPMPDLALLESHFRDTLGTLLFSSAKILGDGSEASAHVAEHAGLAQGVARIIARLPYDTMRRQLFIPAGHAPAERQQRRSDVCRQDDARHPCNAGSADIRRAGATRDSAGNARRCVAGCARGVPAHGAGEARSGANGPSGSRSVRAPCQIAAADPVDAVARVALSVTSASGLSSRS
jgi:phytoene/squalene synthetase